MLVVAVQQVSFLLRAALLSVLLCGPCQVMSDSDEMVLTEWEIWKSSYGVIYDELVRLAPRLQIQPPTVLGFNFPFWCVWCCHAGRQTKEGHLGGQQANH